MSSFFKRPSWATTGREDPDPDFYRRSQQTYSDILAASRERKDHQEAPDVCHTSDARLESRKRRRLSADHNHRRPCDPPSPKTSSNKEDPKPTKPTSPADTRFNIEIGHALARPDNGVVVDLDDPGVDTDATSPANRDDAIFDCASTPKERAEKDETLARGSSPAHCQAHVDPPASARKSSPGPDTISDRPPPPLLEDPVVEIMITSDIPNTRPLVVLRKASQSLKEVRLAWCSRQNMSEEEKSSVFLTWKGRRLFDVTTCRSLGLDKLRGLLGSTDLLQDNEHHRIQVQAVTEELFAESTKRHSHTPEDPVSTVYDAGTDQSGPFIRVTLKCPGLEEHKVKVKPSTSISRLIASFRRTRSVSSERQVHLVFDGDRLDPASSLAAYDIADLDLIEVQLR